MTNASEVRTAETQGWLDDCIESVCRAFDEYRDATGPVAAAFALTELNDRVSDLRTYHPGFDSDSGTMPYDRDGA